jgi:hypothetical protein
MNILILACGQQDRFKNGIKQLLRVDNETLLNRTIRLCQPYKPTIVTWKPELKGYDANYFYFNEKNCVLNTLRSTHITWDEKNIVLLGDVYYTEDCMKRILSCEKDIAFFTDINDIFAFVFTDKYTETMGYELKACIDEYENEPVVRFRDLWRHFGGWWRHLEMVCDRTQDFDHDHEYEDFLQGKSKNRLFNLMNKYKA